MSGKKICRLLSAVLAALLILSGCTVTYSEEPVAAEPAAAVEAEAAETAAEAEPEILTVKKAGMDITLPQAWSDSELLLSCQSDELFEDVFLTSAALFACTEEEYDEAVEKYGESPELGEFLSERISDLFLIFSVKDTISKEELISALTGGGTVEIPDFDLEEIGRADGWVFYNTTGGFLRRSEPKPGKEAAVEAMISTLPELISGIRFYEPVVDVMTGAGMQLHFETVDFDGNPVNSRELFASNKITMINIWMSWCHYCVEEMPELEEMSKRFAADGGAVIGLMLDGDEEEALEIGKGIVEEAGVTFPILIPTEEIKEQFIVPGYPTTIFVNSDGVVIGEPIVGMNPAGYEERMTELLAE